MSLQDRIEVVYQQDVRGIAERYLNGNTELAASSLKKWAPLYDKTIEEMWADAVTYLLQKVLPGLRFKVLGVEETKKWGKETYYRYGWGVIPVDEAIKRYEALVIRCEGIVIEPPV
ncbi:hypothetical protein ES708_23297 [subsurface metagenome]